MTEYEIIFSKRKTLSLQVNADGKVIVRAPLRTGKKYIEDFVAEHEVWIARAKAKVENKKYSLKEALPEEEKALRKRAKEILPGKVRHYAALAGVSPGRITVTGARTRFGSCSGKNNISFSSWVCIYIVYIIAVRTNTLSNIFYNIYGSIFI
jgi:predicted metal-dependent hydrolase